MGYHSPKRRNEALLNTEQRTIYNNLLNAILNENQRMVFLDGKAGRGKTFLICCLMDRLRSLHKIVLPTATTAFAAQQYEGCRTTHSTFKVSLSVMNRLIPHNANNVIIARFQ